MKPVIASMIRSKSTVPCLCRLDLNAVEEPVAYKQADNPPACFLITEDREESIPIRPTPIIWMCLSYVFTDRYRVKDALSTATYTKQPLRSSFASCQRGPCPRQQYAGFWKQGDALYTCQG